jgi:hypothetical protein
MPQAVSERVGYFFYLCDLCALCGCYIFDEQVLIVGNDLFNTLPSHGRTYAHLSLLAISRSLNFVVFDIIPSLEIWED